MGMGEGQDAHGRRSMQPMPSMPKAAPCRERERHGGHVGGGAQPGMQAWVTDR